MSKTDSVLKNKNISLTILQLGFSKIQGQLSESVSIDLTGMAGAMRSGEKAECEEESRLAVDGRLWMKEQDGESCLCFSVGQSPACQPSAVTLHLKHCTRSPTPV